MSAGDAIVIYCAGLGAVNPPVTAGTAAPSSPPAITTNPVTVTIGGKTAQVFFSGLVGGFAGLYQVNAYVPKGITPGDAVPLSGQRGRLRQRASDRRREIAQTPQTDWLVLLPPGLELLALFQPSLTRVQWEVHEP